MKFVYVVFTVLFVSLSLMAESKVGSKIESKSEEKAILNKYCQTTMKQFISEYREHRENFLKGKITTESYDSVSQQLLLSVDQAGNDCANDYPEESRENVKVEFMDQYRSSVADSNVVSSK